MNEHMNWEILRPLPKKLDICFVDKHFLKKIHQHLSNQYFKILLLQQQAIERIRRYLVFLLIIISEY